MHFSPVVLHLSLKKHTGFNHYLSWDFDSFQITCCGRSVINTFVVASGSKSITSEIVIISQSWFLNYYWFSDDFNKLWVLYIGVGWLVLHMNQPIMSKMILMYDVTNIAFTNEEKTKYYAKTRVFSWCTRNHENCITRIKWVISKTPWVFILYNLSLKFDTRHFFVNLHQVTYFQYWPDFDVDVPQLIYSELITSL